MKQNSIVVFGGSFNPPLNSHFSIAQEVLNQYEQVEKIVFVPVNDKYPKKELIKNKHRYNMLKLVAEKNSNFIVSDIEIKKEKSIPTIDTLEEIQKQYPNKEIWFLMGSDNLKTLHTWDKANDLVSKYKILVMERNQDEIEEIIKQDTLLNSHKENFIKLTQSIKSNYSASYVRKQIKNGKSVRYLMPDEVYQYIEQNKLYRE